MPVFDHPELMFLAVKDSSKAGQKRLKKSLVVMLDSPWQLYWNLSRFAEYLLASGENRLTSNGCRR